MFESVEQRSKHRPWRTFGIVSAIFFAALWLVVRAHEQEEEQRVDEAREERERLRTLSEQPRTLKTAGLELEIPRAEDARGGTDRRGAVQGGAGLHAWGILWEPGGVSVEERARAAALVRSVIENQAPGARATEHERTVGGVPGYEIRLGDAPGKLAALMLVVPCGQRRITMFVTGDDARGPLDRMAATYHCGPPPRVVIPVAVDPTPGWKQAPGQEPGVLDGPHDLRLQTNLLVEDLRTVAGGITNYFRGSHFTLYEPPSVRNDKLFYRAQLVTGGKTYAAAILAWRCTNDRVAFIIVTSATSSLDPGILLADTGRCLEPGEPLPDY